MQYRDNQTSTRNDDVRRAPQKDWGRGADRPAAGGSGIHTPLKSRTFAQWVGFAVSATLGVVVILGFIVLCAAEISKVMP